MTNKVPTSENTIYPDKAIKWAARISNVREVTLFGTADLKYWTSRLAAEGLLPAEVEGRARLVISSADARFKGLAFRELSVSVFVQHDRSPSAGDAVCMLGAFNSRRSFAFFERVFFSTPYVYGDVQASTTDPVHIQLVRGPEVLFRAQMASTSDATLRRPQQANDVDWSCTVMLPQSAAGKHGSRRVFFAEISGRTQTFPFQSSADSLTIHPTLAPDIMKALSESDFTPIEWVVRRSACHAKSKTYNRSRFDSLP